MRRFPAPTSPSLSTLHLTRPLYAQILHQRFHLPRPFASVDWIPSSVKEGTDEWRRKDVGMKVVVGFEMAYQASKRTENDGTAFWRKVDEAIAQAGEGGGSQLAEEDSDAWLTVDEAELNDLMSSKVGSNGKPATGQADGDEDDEDEKMAEAEATKMRSFASQLEGFIDGEGAFDGALMDDDELSLDASSDSEQDDLAADLDMLDDEGKVTPGKGKRARMDEGERQKRMDGLVHGLEEGEWGAKDMEAPDAKMTAAVDKVEDKPADVEMIDAEIGSSAALADSAKTKRGSTNGKPSDVPAPRLARPTYDGVVDESSEDEDDDPDDPFRPGGPGLAALDEEGKLREDKGEDVDMGGEEEEFLAFARDALGLTEEQYEGILESRRKKGGAYMTIWGLICQADVRLLSVQPTCPQVRKRRSRRRLARHDPTPPSLQRPQRRQQRRSSTRAKAKATAKGCDSQNPRNRLRSLHRRTRPTRRRPNRRGTRTWRRLMR